MIQNCFMQFSNLLLYYISEVVYAWILTWPMKQKYETAKLNCDLLCNNGQPEIFDETSCKAIL